MERSVGPLIRTLTLFAFCALVFGIAPAGRSQENAVSEAVRGNGVSVGETRLADPETRDEWATEKSELFAEMDRMETEIRRLEWERRQTEAFIQDLSEKAEDISAREVEAEALRKRIGPLMDETLQRLSAVVHADLPFAREERSARLERVRRSLGNADSGVVGQVRTVVDAVKAEVEAGYAAETGAADISVNGETVRVRQIHVGRLGLYALSPDNRSAWLWNPEGGEWIAIPEHAPALADAARIAERHRLAELIALPLAPPELGEGG